MDRLSPDRLNALFNNLPLGFVVFDPKGKITYVDDFFPKLTGYEGAELLDQGFYDLLFRSKESNQRIREKTLSALEVPYDDLDLTMTNKKEEKVFIHVAGSNVREDGEFFGVLVIQDVTNKKAFEKVIESSFDNFIQVTNALDSAMKKINEQNQTLEEYKAKMTRELNIAKSVQKAIIPKTFPKIPGFDMYGVSIPSEELGGDYFDFFLLDEKSVGILIADVSGHGVPSSLITTMVKAYFEYYTKRFVHPDMVLQNVNRDMASIIMDTGFYLTAFYCVLNTETLDLTVSIAGHDSAICVTRGRDQAIRLGEGAEGTILGIFPDAEFKSVTYKLEPDSKIIIYTDGITEARSDSGEFYGGERLEKFLASQLGTSSQESVENLVATVDAFYGTNHPNDDRTLVIFDLLPRKGEAFDPKEALNRGKKAFLEKDFSRALEEFETLIHQNQKPDSEVYYLAGQAAGFLGQNSRAIQYMEKSVELDPQSHKSFYYLGILQHNEKNFSQARTAWEKVLELVGSYRDTQSLLDKLEKKA